MAEPATTSSYGAVSIATGQKPCCEAAQKISGNRYLMSQAPTLPLDGCTLYDKCRCKYEKWDDRRQEERRMSDSGIGSQFYHSEEKRGPEPGRRDTD
jgi:hypothetical protein